MLTNITRNVNLRQFNIYVINQLLSLLIGIGRIVKLIMPTIMKFIFGFKWMYYIQMFLSLAATTRTRDFVDISYDEQKQRRHNASGECYRSIIIQPFTRNGSHCPRVWDEILCWPETAAGVKAILPCPNYVKNFDTLANASRLCTEDGTWYYDVNFNKTWSDYTQCMIVNSLTPISALYKAHMGRLRMMYNIGYGLSLASLVLALLVMLIFKRLHCARNTIHINLFTSFMLRASISFMKENLLVQGLAFPADVKILSDGRIDYIEEGTHWQCKMFFTVFNYILGANYMWILVEALYLHMLISVAVFSEKTGIKWYMLFGWMAPLTFVLPWAIVRAKQEDVYCWNTHPTAGYLWIMRGPIVSSIVINFVIFLNLIRVLFTKLNAINSPEAKKFRYQKLAKSTLVLIPLFGVHYIVFLGLPDAVDERLELTRLYFEMFFNSTQGFFVALLFCFLNGEVQNEIKKYWRRFKLTRLQNLNHGRSHFSTFTTYVSKFRGSVSSFSNNDDLHEGNQVYLKSSIHEGTALNVENVEINKKYVYNGSVVKANIDEDLPMMTLPVKVENCQNVNVNHNGHL